MWWLVSKLGNAVGGLRKVSSVIEKEKLIIDAENIRYNHEATIGETEGSKWLWLSFDIIKKAEQ